MRRPPAPTASIPRLKRPHQAGVLAWVAAVAVAGLGLSLAAAHPPSAPPNASAGAAVRPAAPSPTASPSPKASKAATASGPAWSELTARQRQALEPLAPHWHGLSAGHKRKWLALSRNYATMSADDQTTLHSRMIEWAALSNQQRAQARLNFAEVKRVPADERKAKWEEYQALSEAEKRRLAEQAPARPRGAAIPVRPVPADKLVAVPALATAGQHTPRILLAPPPAAALPAEAILSPAPAEKLPVAVPALSLSNSTPQPIPAEAQVLVPTPSSPRAGQALEQPLSP